MAQVLQTITQIPISDAKVSKFNVRKDAGDISELVLSIKSVGVLEPIVARPVGRGFEVIIGSRRLVAAKRAGLRTIPAIVKTLSDDEAILESLVENLQRGDLSEEEMVIAYRTLHDFDPDRWTQQAFADRIGKHQSWVSGLLAAYETLITLKKAGVMKGMKSYPREEERKKGIAPVEVLKEIDRATKLDTVRETLTPADVKKKTIELGKVAKDLPHDQAVRVVHRFKMYPEKPVSELREEALAETAGVALKTYLPPKMARQIEEKTGRSVEEAITQVIERGLESIPTSGEAQKPIAKHWADELTQDPISVQVANWWKWNRERLDDKFDFFTTHYAGKDLDTFVETLKANGVKTLIDVRDTPFSQFRPEFNKDSLSKNLKSKGIDYSHTPELGVPKDQREKLVKSGDWSRLFEWYDNKVAPKVKHILNDNVKDRQKPVAFMCVEKDPQKCHRHRIALALEKTGLNSLDI